MLFLLVALIFTVSLVPLHTPLLQRGRYGGLWLIVLSLIVLSPLTFIIVEVWHWQIVWSQLPALYPLAWLGLLWFMLKRETVRLKTSIVILFGITVSLCLTYEWLLFIQTLPFSPETLSRFWYVGRIAVVCLAWGIVVLLHTPQQRERWLFPLAYAVAFVLLQGQASNPASLSTLRMEAVLSVLLACTPLLCQFPQYNSQPLSDKS